MVGGELTMDMLDLSFNPIAKFYEAPIQLKANGGVFLVDDFGRQRMRPQDLLNRWIVPLESRVDYLTLHTGKKFQVPFDVLIVFATNLNPASLADEAFLRRIPYKIAIEDPTVDQFTRIFELNCQQPGPALPSGDGRVPAAAPLRPDAAADARLPSARSARTRDRACAAIGASSRSITRELLDAACSAYFVDDEPAGGRAAAGARRPRGPRWTSTDVRAAARRGVGHATSSARAVVDRAVLADVGRTCSATSCGPATSRDCCCSPASRSSSC